MMPMSGRQFSNLLLTFLTVVAIFIAGPPVVLAQAPSSCVNPKVNGCWDHVQYTGTVPVHVVLLKDPSSSYAGQLLFWNVGMDARVWRFHANELLPTAPSTSQLDANYPPVPIPTAIGVVNPNIFCAGLCTLADGKALITGGTDQNVEGIGQEVSLEFDPAAFPNGTPWSFEDEPLEQLQLPRWYPTNTTLPNGDVLTSSGNRYHEMVVIGGQSGSGLADASQVRLFGLRPIPTYSTGSLATGDTPPSARRYASLAFDDSKSFCCAATDYITNPSYITPPDWKFAQRIILFGGEGLDGHVLPPPAAVSSNLNCPGQFWQLTRSIQQEWKWNLPPISNRGGPNPKSQHSSMIIPGDPNVRDQGARMIVYGGKSYPTDAIVDSVWMLVCPANEAQGDVWTPLSPSSDASASPSLPGARRGHTAVYNNLTGNMLMFGGLKGVDYMNDIWELSGLGAGGSPQWHSVPILGDNTITQGQDIFPEGRTGATFLFEGNYAGLASGLINRAYLFGGCNASTTFNDFWTINFGAATPRWKRIFSNSSASATMPAPRHDAMAIIDPDPHPKRRIILYGGFSSVGGASTLNDVWSLPIENVVSSPSPVWAQISSSSPSGNGLAGGGVLRDVRDIRARFPERYDIQTDHWALMNQAEKWQELYPFMFVLPQSGSSSKVFYAGPEDATSTLAIPAGGGSGTWSTPTLSSGFPGGSAVMYAPNKIMKCGSQGSNANTPTAKWTKQIDLSSTTPSWEPQGTDLPSTLTDPRSKHNLTVLPNGQVLLTGGSSGDIRFADNPRKEAQIWKPPTAITNPGMWTSDLAPESYYRDYHSTAILLPDARVLSAGGEVSINAGSELVKPPNTTVETRSTAQIYYPPYLFNNNNTLATQPTITCAPACVRYGETFVVFSPDAATVRQVCLMRPGAVTHQFNQNQRYVPCTFGQGTIANSLTVQGPASGNDAPPGDYMLFILKDGNNPNYPYVPSVASWVRIAP